MNHVDSGIPLLPILLMIAAVLVVLGIGIILVVLTKDRREKLRRHSVVSHLLAMLWAFPVIAVLSVVLYLSLSGLHTPATEVVSGDESVSEDIGTNAPADRSRPICADSPGSEDLPAWVCQPQARDSRRKLVVIVGKQFVTVEEAEQNALQQAEQRLRADFERSHPADATWTIPLELVQTPVLLRNRFLRRIKRTSGSTTFHVQQMILQLELSPEGRKLIYPVWRDRIVGHRLWILGRVLLLLTGILTMATLYFRLDARTDGQFRLRLKLAAIVAIVAFGILIEKTSSIVERIVVG